MVNNTYYNILDFGAVGDGKTLCTTAIQEAINTVSENGGGVVIIPKGIFLTGSLYVKSGVELQVGEGAELLGVVDESAYPEIWTRVAGIEMNWPSALINVLDQKDVKITGKGTINGQGAFWWNKYWGTDRKGGMRKDYEAKGLRWVVDYDCTRPRLILVWQSSNVELEGLSLKQSPFWTVHICYSTNVKVEGLTISENNGPSTDGIDIDSSNDILVQNCDIDCNDDNICIKAGRDADGLRVNKPTENVIIRDCTTRKGHGMVTLGSETSGGMRNIEIYNIKAFGTNNGIRFKSATIRGGIMENIHFHHIDMKQVKKPFAFDLNWNPIYSYSEAIDKLGDVPEHWKVLATPVLPPEKGIPVFRNIKISDITAEGADEAIMVDGLPQKPIYRINLENIRIEASKTGYIKNASDWAISNVNIKSADGIPVQFINCCNIGDIRVNS